MNLSSLRSSKKLLFRYFLSLDSPGERVFLITAGTVVGERFSVLQKNTFVELFVFFFPRETFPEEEQDPNTSLSDGKGAAQPAGSKPGSITEPSKAAAERRV